MVKHGMNVCKLRVYKYKKHADTIIYIMLDIIKKHEAKALLVLRQGKCCKCQELRLRRN